MMAGGIWWQPQPEPLDTVSLCRILKDKCILDFCIYKCLLQPATLCDRIYSDLILNQMPKESKQINVDLLRYECIFFINVSIFIYG